MFNFRSQEIIFIWDTPWLHTLNTECAGTVLTFLFLFLGLRKWRGESIKWRQSLCTFSLYKENL